MVWADVLKELNPRARAAKIERMIFFISLSCLSYLFVLNDNPRIKVNKNLKIIFQKNTLIPDLQKPPNNTDW